MQFGYLSLFVAAVPFLPFLACIKNFFEIRVDGWKLVTGFRFVKVITNWKSVLHLSSLILRIADLSYVKLMVT